VLERIAQERALPLASSSEQNGVLLEFIQPGKLVRHLPCPTSPQGLLTASLQAGVPIRFCVTLLYRKETVLARLTTFFHDL
jgi:hypothetical protein